MAQIVINEHSQNYTYNVGANSFATVALPITACWGPGLAASAIPLNGQWDADDVMDGLRWERFPANQEGLEAFVATYRGPSSNYRIAKDYSYQMAMTLLTAGYDILICRVAPGASAQCSITLTDKVAINVKAKYAGTFGNTLQVKLKQTNRGTADAPEYLYSLVVYVKDSSGVMTAVENLAFVLNDALVNDDLLHVNEVESKFVDLTLVGAFNSTDTEPELPLTVDDPQKAISGVHKFAELNGGTDVLAAEPAVDEETALSNAIDNAIAYANKRYKLVYSDEEANKSVYIAKLTALKGADIVPSISTLHALVDHEWKCWAAMLVYDLLKDKLAYNPQRIVSPWDDQCVAFLDADATIVDDTTKKFDLSPMHIKLMEIGYYSRCAAPMIDIPKGLPRKYVHIADGEGYAQLLARYTPDTAIGDINTQLYVTHSALFAPWGQYRYAGTARMNAASPSFMALMIQRAMILNQAIQYEWALPTNRSHNLNFGKLDYEVSKKLLDKWQTLEGVGVNVITKIPDLGTCLWGNSTLMEVPPATYNALANLSTRYLINAVENVVYKCGISITFQYNNEQAYNKFYAGVTPILDTMKNVGAIDGYYVKMAADINGLDQVNANTVIGKVYLVINGVVNDIVVDLIALPPGTDLNQFKG